MIFIECATDNTNRSVTNLRTYFNKADGQLLDSGALQFMFNRKAVVEFAVPDGKETDDIELELIDYGLDELVVNEGTAYAYGDD